MDEAKWKLALLGGILLVIVAQVVLPAAFDLLSTAITAGACFYAGYKFGKNGGS